MEQCMEQYDKFLFVFPFHKHAPCRKLHKCSYVLLYSAAGMGTVGAVITVIMNHIH